jgi:hypothetical protein
MSQNYLRTIGESPVDNLVRGNNIFQNRIEVILSAGTYPRGQALVLASDGFTASTPTSTTEVLDAVLLDDIGEVDEATRASASLTGEFNQNSMDFGEIEEANLQAVLTRTRSERQLDIAPMHQAPFIQFGGES